MPKHFYAGEKHLKLHSANEHAKVQVLGPSFAVVSRCPNEAQ